ncbi:CAMK family protein kinase [Trichomonas vaginalis G3]|uniref:non-specific serine/threonine protein kinase n=1 Tax=Trichomonas vaginalis (strain ATCC PRA-98 / G3) TaxID=412133 RepID=A2DRR6_TRIV3|nr:protein serine/threonine kinase protein [Trichomonas vaginalis G3]EAY16863.1 CAMK family protein kinase [Trichomonas vaginalis G3]KAI5489150.1 protein serine/threonine kinase protein [Trichomonas vaginalis G3]|eukprot:XP_001329086.1 CAMK family protein kinase [Trichomonas vaginalis G3]
MSEEIPEYIHHYKINGVIGSGAFATVYKAYNPELRRLFAIKCFKKSNLKNSKEEETFQREIDTMAYMDHPGLVKLHNIFEDENNFYLVLDYCAGGELFDYILKKKRLDEHTAALVFKQIVSAISYCHSFGIAHRDLKPENILIDKFPKVMISDFGLCGYLKESTLMSTFVGSPIYTAPECLQNQEYDGRLSDIWSLGVILFGMVTGEHPWKTNNTAIMLKQIYNADFTYPSYLSNDVKELIGSMLKVDPLERKSLENILKNDWFDNEKKSPFSTSMVGKKLLTREEPEVPEIQMSALAEQSRCASKLRFDHNIVSPFTNDFSPRMYQPHLVMKLKCDSPKPLCAKQSVFKKAGTSLSMQRQMSSLSKSAYSFIEL